jgi:hypothetical protein
MTRLLNNVSVDTVGTAQDGDGGSKVITVWASNFGGGSVAIEASPDGGATWITLTYGGNPAVFTTNTIRLIDRIGQGMQIRAVFSGSTGASNVCADLSQ